MTVGVTLENTGLNLSRVIVIFPLPQADRYQDIENLAYTGASLLSYKKSTGQYLRFVLEKSDLPAAGETKTISFAYDATLYDLSVDFAKITDFPADPNYSEDILQYTRSNGDLILSDNATLQSIAENLWSQSANSLEYAEKCYTYVAENYSYLNPNTGIHPLAELLTQGGGDCGNLSSIFISLLRSKNIPAKHLVAVRPNGTYHVWADFYLQNYGWIPVDVTFKNSDSSGDYFGKIGHSSNGVVVSEDLNHVVALNANESYTADLIQTYLYWYWYSNGSGELNVNYFINSDAQ